MKKVILMYPPNNPHKRIKSGYSFLEKKCSIPFINYACNDLGYIAAGLENKGFDVFLKDYKTENLTPLDVLDDILHYEPDVICLMTNPYSLGDDLKIARMMKSSSPETNIILCSDLFFNPDEKFLDSLNLTGIDYMVGNDAEFVVPELIPAIFENNNISEIPFILYNSHNTWVKNRFDEQKYDINNLPLVARDLMNNNIYTRKDTERPVATILVSSEKTIFNSETDENAVITIGRRTPKSVFDEMLLCFNEYAIRDFYMESESFAKDEQWVTELCSMIDDSIMAGEINWFAKVKVGQVSELSTQQMQISGCRAVSVNYLSGSDETIQKVKKDIFSFEECVETSRILRLADLKTYGEFFIGFPWEDFSNLQDTKDLIFKTLPNVLIISLVLPFPGSNEEKLCLEMGVIKNPLIINNNLTIPVLGTKYLTNQHLNDFRAKLNSTYYINPGYIIGKLKDLKKQPKEFEEYFNKVKDFCLKFIKKG